MCEIGVFGELLVQSNFTYNSFAGLRRLGVRRERTSGTKESEQAKSFSHL
jgi:hypothetical protein